ncbi:hypothetical protein LMG3458_01954 [Achromobacter deleyi]|uniref:Uncharacterized protein n=1 Tax=Achromobacter deleyi TaxID=1353891 RepID=A0A6S6ZQ99_9BURK|nr:hypothetical protein [Achromobacter deleyi]CAB3687496.1 hypothetical protein LMG3458_01954 [Achromobacter deleyi]CAB3869656.1 hypothetical protein LMG3482_02714 [Achromobacter deleyi]CAB3878834.1 hypothetical protein LMG3481_03148 [Achromobacter deleyi]
MHRLPLRLAPLIACLTLAGCLATAPVAPQSRVDEIPMYGGMDRSAPDIKAADDKLTADASRAFGSPARAAQAWIEQGYRFYRADQLGMATRRFNQAWLMDTHNPEVYTGFAAVLHDQGKYCDAMKMMETALSLKPPSFQGIYADAGRIAARCAAADQTLSGPERAAMITRSDALFRNGEAVEPDKAYLYNAWASAYYWNGQYADAWAMVAKARRAGGQPGARFLEMLREKMPEPV